MSLSAMIAQKKGKATNGQAKRHGDTEHLPSPEIFLNSPRSKVKTIIRFANTHFGGPGRITSLIGPAGRGKSQVIEAAVSSFLNSHVDTLGIEIIASDQRSILWIDTERTTDEILDGFDRIRRRIVLENNPDLVSENRFSRVHCHSFIGYADPSDKVVEMERLINAVNPCLVLLDGGADLVRDVNNSDECAPVIGKFIALANAFQFSLLTTVHPNPGDGNDHKPRGHYGSELIRKSESVLLLKRAPDDREVRILTTDFAHGKNRSASDTLDHYFKWNDDARMFTSCNYTPTGRPGKAENRAAAFNDVLGLAPLSYTDLAQALVSTGKCGSLPTAKRWIPDGVTAGIIFNHDGLYALTPF